MIRIALTGSIGMGKSTVAKMFERAGIPLFDADVQVRRLQGPDGALIEKIEELFPGTVRHGTLDRDCLAHIVLSDPARLAALERIVHPAVRDARETFMAEHADAPALIFDIPLLLETAGEKEFDQVIVVSAPVERQGMTAAKLDSILARQMPDEEKRARADFIVDTGTDLSTTERQVRDILACLGIAAGG
jgi:dephospho-CoA kinase